MDHFARRWNYRDEYSAQARFFILNRVVGANSCPAFEWLDRICFEVEIAYTDPSTLVIVLDDVGCFPKAGNCLLYSCIPCFVCYIVSDRDTSATPREF